MVSSARTPLLAAALLLAACPAPADLEATPVSLDFGNVGVGTSEALPLSLTNVGENTATVTLTIDNTDAFTVDLGGAIQILPDGSRAVFIYAEPTEVGPASGTLTLAWNAADSMLVPLSVNAIETGPEDADDDGYPAAEDCDDDDPTINPGATEICDGIDNNCTDGADEGFDNDDDGVTSCGPDGAEGTADDDCDDDDDTSYPGAEEVCDTLDNDCNGRIDDGDFDADDDGADTCTDGDCDDDDDTIYPDAAEECDGIDNNCNDQIDEGFDDIDNDGVPVCTDCDDGDPLRYPGNIEVCDAQDNDCDCESDTNGDTIVCGPGDTGVDENAVDADNDGFGCEDCDDGDDAVFPGAPQICDMVLDNDCDTIVDTNEADADTDGASTCAGDCNDFDPTANILDDDNDGVDTCGPDGVADSGDEDCDDTDPSTLPGGMEVCDGDDDDCDGTIDETFDLDVDLVTTCGPDGIPGTADDDCDDGNPAAYPGAPETCSGTVDLNCDGALPAPCTGVDCADILNTLPTAASGVYNVDPAGNGVGFDVYCDMDTDGGGWTMVMRTTDDGVANAAMAAAGSYTAVHDDFVPLGYDPSLGTPVRVPAQYWPDFADVGEAMVRQELLKADGTTCSPLYFSATGSLTVPAVSVGLNMYWTMTGSDPNDVLNGTQSGVYPILQTTDRYTIAPGCVPTNGAAPWFMGTCNGGLMPAQGAGYWSATEPRPVVYFTRVTTGTELYGTSFAAACGGAAMLHPPSATLGTATDWYTHATLEYYFR